MTVERKREEVYFREESADGKEKNSTRRIAFLNYEDEMMTQQYLLMFW